MKAYKTAPFDARFPNTNQTRNCFQNYLGKPASRLNLPFCFFFPAGNVGLFTLLRRGGKSVRRKRDKRKVRSVSLRFGTLNVGTITGKVEN